MTSISGFYASEVEAVTRDDSILTVQLASHNDCGDVEGTLDFRIPVTRAVKLAVRIIQHAGEMEREYRVKYPRSRREDFAEVSLALIRATQPDAGPSTFPQEEKETP